MGATQAPVEWISPGLSALFEALSGDRGYSILDLADHAGNSHLEVLGQFSRQIRFAGLAPSPPHGDAFASALPELPPGPCAYDVRAGMGRHGPPGPPRTRTLDGLPGRGHRSTRVAARCRGLVGRRVGPASSSHAHRSRPCVATGRGSPRAAGATAAAQARRVPLQTVRDRPCVHAEGPAARVCGTEALTKPVRRWQWCRAGRQAAETRTPPPGRAWPLRYNAVKVPLKGNLVRAPSGAGPFPDNA